MTPTEPGDGGPSGRPGAPEMARLSEAFPELEIEGLVVPRWERRRTWCPSRLKTRPGWITVYGLVLMPALWLLGLTLVGGCKDPSPYAQFVQWVQGFVVVAGELVVVMLLMAGGMEASRVEGVRTPPDSRRHLGALGPGRRGDRPRVSAGIASSRS